MEDASLAEVLIFWGILVVGVIAIAVITIFDDDYSC